MEVGAFFLLESSGGMGSLDIIVALHERAAGLVVVSGLGGGGAGRLVVVDTVGLYKQE